MYEINLVPDVKAEAIKAQKARNLVFFVSGTVSAIAIGLVVFLFMFKAAQDITIGSQDKRLESLSAKLNEYDGLSEVLTIQRQLSGLQEIEGQKKVLSRVYGFLAAMVPRGADSVTISSLSVDLENYMMTIEGQALAGAGTDGVNYRVLEAFSKQVGMTTFDYGRYVDDKGNEIPTMCISETDARGIPLVDEEGYTYGVWARGVKGCDPSDTSSGETAIDEGAVQEVLADEGEEQSEGSTVQSTDTGELVRIYRTPRYQDWYRNGHMTSSGEISDVEHFESQCIRYNLTENGGTVVPVMTNNCKLAMGDFSVSESSNGKADGGQLVLRFEGSVELNPQVFSFNNKHVIAISPTGGTNVTDSYLQIDSIFSNRAADCEEGDTSCSK